MKKVAACKVKPYKLKKKEGSDSDKSKDDQVLLEDRLKDVNICSIEKDLENDAVEVKYLKMESSVSFSGLNDLHCRTPCLRAYTS